MAWHMNAERMKMIADLRFLAAARKEYCPGCPKTQSDMAAMNQIALCIHEEHVTAAMLADILEGTNTAHGWLPSWRWDAWNARGPQA